MTPKAGAGASRAVWRVSALPLLFALCLIAVEAGLVARRHLLAADIVDALVLFALITFPLVPGLRYWVGRNRAAVRATLGLALLPLMRLVALGLPLHGASAGAGTLAVAGLISWAVLWLAPELNLTWERLARRPASLVHAASAAAGLGLGLLAYFLGAHRLWGPGATGGAIALALAAGAAAVVVEELVFRGAILITLQRAAGRVGALLAAAVFVSTYLYLGSAALILVIALTGLAFTAGVARGASLWGAVAGHLLFVLGAGGIWPSILGVRHGPLLHGALTTALLAGGAAVAALWLLRGPGVTPPVSARLVAELLGDDPVPERELMAAIVLNSARTLRPAGDGNGVSGSRAELTTAPERGAREDVHAAAHWLLARQQATERLLLRRHGMGPDGLALFGVVGTRLAGEPALCGLLFDEQGHPVAAVPLGPLRPLEAEELAAAVAPLRAHGGLSDIILMADGEHLSQTAREQLGKGDWSAWVIELTRSEVESLSHRVSLRRPRLWRSVVVQCHELFGTDRLFVRHRPGPSDVRLELEARLELTQRELTELARRAEGSSPPEEDRLAEAASDVLRDYGTRGQFRIHIEAGELTFARDETQLAADRALEETAVLRAGGRTEGPSPLELWKAFERLQRGSANILFADGLAPLAGLDGRDRARAELLLKLLVLKVGPA